MGNDYAPYRGLKSEATAPSQSPGLTIESRLLCVIEAKKGVDFFTVTLSMTHVEHSDHMCTQSTQRIDMRSMYSVWITSIVYRLRKGRTVRAHDILKPVSWPTLAYMHIQSDTTSSLYKSGIAFKGYLLWAMREFRLRIESGTSMDVHVLRTVRQIVVSSTPHNASILVFRVRSGPSWSC
jgi:hypothetical protein